MIIFLGTDNSYYCVDYSDRTYGPYGSFAEAEQYRYDRKTPAGDVKVGKVLLDLTWTVRKTGGRKI